MDNKKNLDNLLKELNDMQMQFDNLKENIVIDNKKKRKSVKTKLSSDKIDDDFFKTLSNAPTKIDNSKKVKNTDDLIKETDNKDELLFSLDNENIEIKKEITNTSILEDKKNAILNNSEPNNIEQIEVEKPIESDFTVTNLSTITSDNNKIEEEPITKIDIIRKKNNSKVEIISKNHPLKESKNKLKDININTSEDEFSQKSYLSIKQKLDRIKKKIAEKEAKINKENNITKPKVIKSKTKSKKLETKFVKPETKVINLNNDNLLSNKVLSPTKKENKATQPIKKEIRKEPKTVNEKPNNNNTIDVLTIIILLLIIALIGTAWFILM